MKMNGPVDCKGFFADEIKHNRKGLWCVSLQPNGRILSLIEAKMHTPAQVAESRQALKKQAQQLQEQQILIAHIHPSNPIFEPDDWRYLEIFNQVLKKEGVPLCDYLKISGSRYSSLIKHIAIE